MERINSKSCLGASILLMLALCCLHMGSASAKLSEDDVKTLEQLRTSLSLVTDWKTFTTDSSYAKSSSYTRDIFIPTTEDAKEENTVQFEKSEGGQYKAYTNIIREDIYEISIFGYKEVSNWQFEWVSGAGGEFWLKIDQLPAESQIPQAAPEIVGTWQKADDDLRAGSSDPFTDHIDAGMDSAKFLEEKSVESIEEVQGEEIDGTSAQCYEITPASKKTTSLKEMNMAALGQQQSTANPFSKLTLKDFPNGELLLDKELVAAAQETERLADIPNEVSYTVCISEETKDLLRISESTSIGPFSAFIGSHYYSDFTIKEDSIRTYSGFNEPVDFPDVEEGSPQKA